MSGTNDICGTCGMLVVHQIDCPEHALRKEHDRLRKALEDIESMSEPPAWETSNGPIREAIRNRTHQALRMGRWAPERGS